MSWTTNIYGYDGPPRVNHRGHLYYNRDVGLRENFQLPKFQDQRPSQSMDDALQVLVSGGSMGGLFTALALLQSGHDVTVFERTPEDQMESRGAGILTDPELIQYLIDQGLARGEDISIRVSTQRYLDHDGSVRAELDREIISTSWDAVYRDLRRAITDDRYHMGKQVTGVTQNAESVTLILESGEEKRGDLMVAAEGYRSTARQQLLPDTPLSYAGYVAWRGVETQDNLPESVSTQFRDVYTIYHAPEFQILVYPVHGPNGEVNVDDRRINWVWYWNVPQGDALRELLTDSDGVQREYSIPEGTIRDEIRNRQVATANDRLPSVLARLVEETTNPFIQGIYDLAVPQMVFGRACLLGDAAFFVRPHMAAGTAKAAADGIRLGEELHNYDNIYTALMRWEADRLATGARLVAQGQHRGNRYMGTHLQTQEQ